MTTGFLLLLAVDLVLHDEIAQIFKEGHAIELVSGLYLLAAAALLVVTQPAHSLGRQWHLPVILVLMALREFDLDKRLTSEGILQLRLYTEPSPWGEKLAGAMIVALILVCGWRLLRHTMPDFLRGLRAGSPASLLCLAAGVMLVLSKTLDGLGRKLAALGYRITEDANQFASRTEELLELGVAMMLVMAIASLRRT